MRSLNNTITVLIVSAITAILPALAESADIGAMLREASREGVFRESNDRELRRAEELFVRTLKGEPATILREGWRGLNFELHELAGENENFILLREREGHRTGRGFFLVRRGGNPILLQMPHSFKDEQTRRIGLDMALEGRCLVAVWNTVPRWYDERGYRVDADLAHLPDSYFTALTRAFLRVTAAGTVAQLHGFEAGKRKSSPGAKADVIISSGTKSVTSRVRKAAACLAKDSGAKVLVYPTDVRELGGTTNSIAMLMGELGSSGFIHLELSGKFRSELKNSASLRSSMNRCLEEASR